MRNEKGIILTITVIFILILVIMAGVALIFMTNQGRITEGQIRRTKAFYTAQSAIIKAFEDIRAGVPFATVNGSTLPLNGLTATVNIETISPGTGPNGTRKLTAAIDY